jgi:hypothetical protein
MSREIEGGFKFQANGRSILQLCMEKNKREISGSPEQLETEHEFRRRGISYDARALIRAGEWASIFLMASRPYTFSPQAGHS